MRVRELAAVEILVTSRVRLGLADIQARTWRWAYGDFIAPDDMPRIWDPSGPPSGAPMIQVDTMLFCAGFALIAVAAWLIFLE